MSTSQREILYNIFMKRLKELRNEFGYTQKEVAELLHVRQNTYSQYETGARELPISVLKQLAILYKTTADYILELSDDE